MAVHTDAPSVIGTWSGYSRGHRCPSHSKERRMSTRNFLLIGVAAASLVLAGCATSPGYSGRPQHSGYGSSTASCYDCGTVTRIELIRTATGERDRRRSGRHRRRGRRSRDLCPHRRQQGQPEYRRRGWRRGGRGRRQRHPEDAGALVQRLCTHGRRPHGHRARRTTSPVSAKVRTSASTTVGRRCADAGTATGRAS